MDDVEKETVFDILTNFGFYDNIPKTGLQLARMRDASNNLPEAIAKIRDTLFPSNENVENSSDLQGEGIEKIEIIPPNIIDIYTRLEILLSLYLSGHTKTLTKASKLEDELYKRGEL